MSKLAALIVVCILVVGIGTFIFVGSNSVKQKVLDGHERLKSEVPGTMFQTRAMKWVKPIQNERGEATLIATLLVMTTLLVLAFASVPYFVFVMQRNHLQTIAGHALKEAEVAGMVTPAIMARTAAKMAAVGMETVTVDGTTYPSFAGSTTVKTLRDSPDPTVRLVIKYPASNLSRIFTAIGGSNESSNGFYYLEVTGRSEAYE
jgi:hypothetical protein